MVLSSWLPAVFNRYNIVSEDDIKDAARKIEEGAKAVVHSLAIVTPETDSEKERRMSRSLYNQ